MALPALDLAILVGWLVVTVALGLVLAGRSRTVGEFVLAGRDLPAWALLVSIVATETSTVTFLSVPSLAYRGDWTFLQLAFGYIFGRSLVAWWLLPRYFQGRYVTAYELLAEQLGPGVQRAAGFVFTSARTVADGLRLFLGGIVLQKVCGLELAPAVAALGLATIVFTFLGGMRAVVWTDVLQFVTYMLGAALALFLIGQALPGGLDGVWEAARAAGKLRVIDPSNDPSDPMSALTAVLGGAGLSFATHGVDQMFVQRYLCARSLGQARKALVASGFVVCAQFALFLAIGTALWAWAQAAQPPLVLGRDEEFATFIVRGLPTGLRGLILGAVFAAALSTLSSSLNSSAASLAHDLWPGPGASDARRLRVARWSTPLFGLAQMGVALGAVHLQQNVVSSALSLAGLTSGLLVGLFLLAALARSQGPRSRISTRAALIGLLAGLAVVFQLHFGGELAWPWFSIVGATATFACGSFASAFGRSRQGLGGDPS